MFSFSSRTLFVSLLLPILLLMHSSLFAWRMQELSPATLTSPSGEYSLFADPSDRYGRGPATYTLSRSGSELWTVRLPFTLWSAQVTNKGETVGFGYQCGYHGMCYVDGVRTEDKFIVAIIAPDGTLRLHDESERAVVPLMVDPNIHSPTGTDIILDEENNCVSIVVTINADQSEWYKEYQWWWPFELSTGKALPRFKVRDRIQDDADYFWLHGASHVAGTPLTLLHWHRYVREPREFSSVFILVDEDFNTVWRETFLNDYDLPDDMKEFNVARSSTAILDTTKPNRFLVKSFLQNQQVEYQVEKDTAWRVIELSRSPIPTPTPAPTPTPNTLVFPNLDAELIETITLGEAPATAIRADAGQSHYRPIVDFAFDEQGRVALLRREDYQSSTTLMLLDAGGTPLFEMTLPEVGQHWLGIRHSAGPRFLLAACSRNRAAAGRFFWMDFTTREVTPVNLGKPLTEISGFDVFPNGDFAVAEDVRLRNTTVNYVHFFGSEGNHLWTIDRHAHPDIVNAFWPDDVITEGDEVIVAGNNLLYFDRNGAYQRMIRLREKWGESPGYMQTVVSDGRGGYLFDTNPVSHADAEGNLLAKIQLKDANGFAFRGEVRADGEGHIWAANGLRLLRLGDDGKSDREIALPGATTDNNDPEVLVLVQGDRIHRLLKNSRSVEVYNSAGRLLHTCKPEPGDLTNIYPSYDLAVNAQDEVFLTDGTSSRQYGGQPMYVHFAADGTRLGIEPAGLSGASFQTMHFQAGTTNRWFIGFKEAALADADGNILKKFERNAANAWFAGGGAGCALSDGGIAIAENMEHRASRFDAEANPIALVQAPTVGEEYTVLAGATPHFVAFRSGAMLHFLTWNGAPIGELTLPGQPIIHPDQTQIWSYDPSRKEMKKYNVPAVWEER
jgi:hypothetical protein